MAPTRTPHTGTTRRAVGAAAWSAVVMGIVLAVVGLGQVALASRHASGGAAAPAPGEHAADAKAVLAAYDENLLDPEPAIRAVLDEVAARPGVAEVALVSGAGVELTGAPAAKNATLVEEGAVPAAMTGLVGRALTDGAAPSSDGDAVAQPLAIHDEPHALIVRRESVPAAVPLADVRWIVAGTLAATFAFFALAIALHNRSLSRRHAHAVLRAGVDPLTGLGGHRLFREELARRAGQSTRREHTLALALLDLDRFADLNAAHGLRHGDAVLAEVGAVLAAGRSDDLPFRIAPDRFAVLFPHTTAAEATVAVERMRASIAGGIPGVTVSAGIAELDAAAPAAGSLLAQAELALHDAKAQGRDRLVVFASGAARSTR